MGYGLISGGRECNRDMRALRQFVCFSKFRWEGSKGEASEGGRTIRSLKSDAVGGGGDRPTNIRKPGHPMKQVSCIPLPVSFSTGMKGMDLCLKI